MLLGFRFPLSCVIVVWVFWWFGWIPGWFIFGCLWWFDCRFDWGVLCVWWFGGCVQVCLGVYHFKLLLVFFGGFYLFLL